MRRVSWLSTAAARLRAGPQPPPDADLLAAASARDADIVRRAMPFSMTGAPRLLSVVDAVRHLERRGVPGAFAECGVWRGGSVLAMILALQDEGAADRDLYLYDSFEGMPEPGPDDGAGDEPEKWTLDPSGYDEESVRTTLLATGYPSERLHIVAGAVEDTLPERAPDQLALLRLDTDWYESTRHELEHLYPRLTDGGVLVVDDYGHWEGARRAVDEYFATSAAPVLLHRIDYTARMAVKH